MLLGCGRGEALGYLEALWHFAGRFTPAGNLGKYSNTAIEGWIEWRGEPGALIAAMLESHWIDLNETHRLVVHDWPEWADDTTQTHLARKITTFWDGSIPASGRLNQTERERYREWVAGLLSAKSQGSSQPAVSNAPQNLPPQGAKPVPVPVPEPVPDPVPVPVARSRSSPARVPEFINPAAAETTSTVEESRNGTPPPLKLLKILKTGFPSADIDIAFQIMEAANEADPGINEEKVMQACISCYGQKNGAQRSPALFLRTIPEYLRSLKVTH